MDSRPPRHPLAQLDWILLVATLLLVALGIGVIHSASRSLETGTPLLQSFTGRQILWALVGLLGLLAMALVDYRLLVSLGKPIYLLTLGLLALVLAAGEPRFGAQRWLGGSLLGFQPSELAKVMLIVALAHFMGSHVERMRRLRWALASGVLVAPALVLVFLQPDLSTAVLIAGMWGMMVLAAGLRWRHLGAGLVLSAVSAPLTWGFLQAYQQERIRHFVDPSSDPAWLLGPGYNITQARIAIGSGGWLGQGFGYGSQSQLHFLRVRHTDFAFSVLGEELGFVGACLLLTLVLVVLWRLLRAADQATTAAGALIPVGVAALLFLQTAINVGMNLALLPTSGVPLPFLSYGGSSLVSLLLAIGLVQSVVRHSARPGG